MKLHEMQKLLSASTPGEWALWGDECKACDTVECECEAPQVDVVRVDLPGRPGYIVCETAGNYANARLIAALVNAAPALLAVWEAALNPDCIYGADRECGIVDGVYKHHPEWCPRGRLHAALRAMEEL